MYADENLGEILFLSNNLDFDGEIIFYDYTQANIDLKKKIVEMNMSLEELNILKEMSDEILVNNIDNSQKSAAIQNKHTAFNVPTSPHNGQSTKLILDQAYAMG